MKFLFIISMIFCAVNGFRFKDVISDHIDVSPHNECANQPNGMRLPHADCNRFILCDSQAGLVLSCRAAEPNFDRCSQRCVYDPLVCTITDCNGGGGEVTSTTVTNEPPITTTTTRFTPPTVQAVCPIPCTSENMPTSCDCIERWICVGVTCQCNANIPCPMSNEDCMALPECGGDCPERCVCETPENCQCDTELQCPFAETECVARCGCGTDCNCETPTTCACNDVCNCPQPPNVCPFAPVDCIARCGCNERCICNGNVCTCDTETHCPANVPRIFMNKN
ncbi:hypothetical protein ACKWTF_015732 [Chironomus riparius]